MSHFWRKRLPDQHLAENLDSRISFTAVQILDVTREGDATDTKRVYVEETGQSQLPELSKGTVLRWIHIKTIDMDYDLLMNFALTHQEFNKEERVSVYRLLKQFRENQQRSSNHGKYFEPACLQQTQLFEGIESVHQPQFISLPYITLGKASSQVNPLHHSIHPILSLLQYHYRQESAASGAGRNSEQAYTKLLGSGSDQILLVNNLWVLILNRSTIITVAPADGDELWAKLKLIDHHDAQPPEPDKPGLWETLDAFAGQLQEKLKLAIEELETTLRYQRRIKSSIPAFLTNVTENQSRESKESPDGFLGFFFLLISTEWITRLQFRFSSLESFLSGNRARFEGRKNVEKSEISAEVELQSESLYLFLYENIDTYIKTFSKVRGRMTIPLRKDAPFVFPSNKATLDRLWLDLKYQSQVFLWKLSAMDLNMEVMTATGLSEIIPMQNIPTEVEQLAALVVDSLVPEDSIETASPKSSDIYSQYIARLQLEAQRVPSKTLVKNIYQIIEELEIIASIAKSQCRVVAQMVKVFQARDRNIDTSRSNPPYLDILNTTLQKLHFFQSDLSGYQNSCSSLGTLATQRLVDSRLDHLGRVILALTTTAMIFLPLLFVSNLFDTNLVGSKEVEVRQWVFWVLALSITIAVASLVLIIAFVSERKLGDSSRSKGSYERKLNNSKED